jgi:hypothetical protein
MKTPFSIMKKKLFLKKELIKNMKKILLKVFQNLTMRITLAHVTQSIARSFSPKATQPKLWQSLVWALSDEIATVCSHCVVKC